MFLTKCIVAGFAGASPGLEAAGMPATMPLIVDPALCRTVLENIITNAVNYSGRDRGKIEIESSPEKGTIVTQFFPKGKRSDDAMNPIIENGSATTDAWPQPLRNAVMEGLAFVGRVFWGPEPEFCATLHQGGGLEFLEEPSLKRMLESSGDIADEIGAAVGLYDTAEALFENLETAYVTLFISNRQGIAAPLYHSCYAGTEGSGSQAMLMGEPALEMKKRLASSGLALAEELNQLPDHLCIEIEYLYFLLKEGWSGEGKERLVEGRTFAGDWMLPWVQQFQHQVRAAEKGGFYTLISSLLVALLTVIGGGDEFLSDLKSALVRRVYVYQQL